MTITDISKIILGIIVALGGGGAIVLGLSNFFGQLLAKRYEEKIKAEFQNGINEYQSQLDIIKQTTIRYSDRQFEQYNSLWSSLYDLRLFAEDLWQQATSVKLTRFSKQLKNTKSDIEKASLFIEEVHYKELVEIIWKFSEFQIGKSELINYRQTDDFDESEVNKMLVRNGYLKIAFEKLVTKVRDDLKKQIRGK